MRPGGVSAEFVASVYQIDEDDADSISLGQSPDNNPGNAAGDPSANNPDPQGDEDMEWDAEAECKHLFDFLGI